MSKFKLAEEIPIICKNAFINFGGAEQKSKKKQQKHLKTTIIIHYR